MLEGESNPESQLLDSSLTQRLCPAEVSGLYESHAAGLLAYLIGVLKNSEQASEALQNTFQRVLEVGHTARRESFQGWLFKVAFHEAMAIRRRIAIERRAHEKYSAIQAIRASESNTLSTQELELSRSEEVTKLRDALLQLPNEQRFVVERRIYHEETFAEIAANLKIPLGTVLTRMRLALQKLERFLS